MKKNQIDFITMGCSKNLVDSEVLMKQFEDNGYKCTHDSKNPQGEIVVINTCGFIADAKEESINTILEFAQAKENGKIRKLFVMGCLSQRYKKELEEEIPQVDKYYGKFDFKQLLADLGKAETATANRSCQNPQNDMGRHLTTPHHYAYIKISEGCDRHCAYCAIPLMTGHHISRPQDEILEEVRNLVASGVKEFQIIAQELTYYGIDIDGNRHIAELVSRMAEIPGVRWIRLHYAYPTDFPFELLDVIREKRNVCKYLDIALQHISDKMLHAMRRNITKEETYSLIERIRERVPGIHIRTTLMVGYPNESDDDFEELLAFTKWARFERMGAFAYSEEEGTYSADNFEDNVSEDVKRSRLDRLMALQQDISAEIAAAKVG
ncbi:MAG: 30S ribosomal protein S12 methylthiotransferase RimO, partial [Clostridia bacterium]|nr:30S ribosomal protein S12 methylthiotransferase RimO [Clostridia bacterium]